ncbi:DUF1919 domain-containing protein [Aeromicrobium sp.]|uniref:DUF1919 domain-containing protein n=1 Tax=Aeromicrobium sp. TaxID=1871063 RepID=UPI0019ABF885|nr:DUF1919 domain-containing protein [Aeromicrobium sp.]MBC7630435.1 DUF1919 domain-containing protein [Aeromicrobium sp.]
MMDRRRVAEAPFTIISDDCWGAEVHRHLGRRYNTPFVGLFLYPPCFLALANDPRRYLAADLRFLERSAYASAPFPLEFPVAALDDIEIHFLHFRSRGDAEAKWYARRERMDWTTLRIKAAVGDAMWSPAQAAEAGRVPGLLQLTTASDGTPGRRDAGTSANRHLHRQRGQPLRAVLGRLRPDGVADVGCAETCSPILPSSNPIARQRAASSSV